MERGQRSTRSVERHSKQKEGTQMQKSSVQRKARSTEDTDRDDDDIEQDSSEHEPTMEERSAEHINRDLDENIPFNKYTDLDIYMKPLRAYPMIRQKSDWERLFRQYHHGDRKQAQSELVYRNMKLVLSIALRNSGRGLPLLDCMQEGVFGLMKAIEKFEIERGWAFSTFASWWVRQAISRAIEDLNTTGAFRVPVHYQERVKMVQKAIQQHWSKNGGWPTNYDVFKIVRAGKSEVAAKITLRDVGQVMRFIQSGRTISMDAERDDEDAHTMHDRISDPQAKTETIVEARRLLPRYQEALGRIERAINALPPRYGMILRLRFGFGEFDAMSLEEVGERYDLTRERIRQLEVDAFTQLETAGIKISSEEVEQLMNVVDELERILEASK